MTCIVFSGRPYLQVVKIILNYLPHHPDLTPEYVCHVYQWPFEARLTFVLFQKCLIKTMYLVNTGEAKQAGNYLVTLFVHITK